jgi:surface antigen
MTASKLAKFAAVLALSTSLVAMGTSASQAGGLPKPLLGGALGAAAGAGAGYAFGKGQGAAIGGIMGLALGAMLAHHLDSKDRGVERVYDGYVPPAPTYDPAAVYQPAPVYQPMPVGYEPPVYQPPSPYPARATTPYGTADAGQNYCQPYSATMTINGVPHPTQGTACLQADGTWRVVN